MTGGFFDWKLLSCRSVAVLFDHRHPPFTTFKPKPYLSRVAFDFPVYLDGYYFRTPLNIKM